MIPAALPAAGVVALEGSVGTGAPERFERGLDRLEHRPPVTVVIPVYNAAVALAACLRSLAESGTDAEVVLVDDSSSDPAIQPMCRRFCDQWPAARLVTSAQNRGFVATVNAGIRAADPASDVVLLNSDTRVTRGWVDKLATAALLDPDVASASPVSNAAGIFSLPEAHATNELPEGWSADNCNRLLEEVSPYAYETLPTTSGFCLYLRRDALDAVGLFDELLLHRGYGEENDFCLRAEHAGFGHRLDDSTFVFHEREASFVGTKAALKRRNSRLLKSMHPEHHDDQVAWEERTGLVALRERYAGALEAVLAEGPAFTLALGEVHTTLVVTGDDDGGSAGWADGSRTAVLRLGPQPRLNFYGAGEVSLEQASPAGTVAWLGHRLGADSLRVVGDALDRRDAERIETAIPRLTPDGRAATAA